MDYLGLDWIAKEGMLMEKRIVDRPTFHQEVHIVLDNRHGGIGQPRSGTTFNPINQGRR